MSVEGVDYAFSKPSAAALAAAGKHFACRYISLGSTKDLTVAELHTLLAAGLAVVLNWEWDKGDSAGGFDAGARFGRQALDKAAALNWPADKPIYFSIDSDTTGHEATLVGPYLRGIASVMPVGRIGVYGGRATIAYAQRQKLATWFWQTYGWSEDRNTGQTVWVPGVHIQQYHNGVRLDGADTDLNRAMVADYGQWDGDDMTAAEYKALLTQASDAAKRSQAALEALAAIKTTLATPAAASQVTLSDEQLAALAPLVAAQILQQLRDHPLTVTPAA